MNFRRLDLNLLRLLAAVHRTGSVTAAGQALALSQPAASNALARLRAFFGDELYVRTPQGLRPTALAERIAPAVAAQLQELEALVSAGQDFDPATSETGWRLSLSDLGEMMFLPPLAAALRSRAPRTRLANVSVAADDVAGALEAREIDFAIGILNPRQRGVRADLLFRERYVGLTSSDWRPASGAAGRALTARQFAQASLAVASPTATFHGSVDQTLQRMNLAGRIVLRARHFGAMPDLALGTDLLAIVPQMYAAELQKRPGFRVWQLPRPASAAYEVRLVWHVRTAQDAAQQWIRAVVHELFRRGRVSPA
jgi:DNA-binding transcriptional LysR family regulator